MRRKESLWGFWWPFTPWSKEGIRRRNGHLHEKHQSFLAMVPILWVNYNDLTATSLEIIVNKGNHPQMAQQFRLVKYYNLPRYNVIYLLDPTSTIFPSYSHYISHYIPHYVSIIYHYIDIPIIYPLYSHHIFIYYILVYIYI